MIKGIRHIYAIFTGVTRRGIMGKNPCIFKQVLHSVLPYLVLLMIISAMVSVESCGKREVRIDRETQRIIDTIAANHIAELNAEMDSICALQFDSLIQVKYDSIMKDRLAEIEFLLKE